MCDSFVCAFFVAQLGSRDTILLLGVYSSCLKVIHYALYEDATIYIFTYSTADWHLGPSYFWKIIWTSGLDGCVYLSLTKSSHNEHIWKVICLIAIFSLVLLTIAHPTLQSRRQTFWKMNLLYSVMPFIFCWLFFFIKMKSLMYVIIVNQIGLCSHSLLKETRDLSRKIFHWFLMHWILNTEFISITLIMRFLFCCCLKEWADLSDWLVYSVCFWPVCDYCSGCPWLAILVCQSPRDCKHVR